MPDDSIVVCGSCTMIGCSPMYTREDLKSQIKAMGIQSNDTVLIHTSMKAIGPVEGGADGVIDAFCDYLRDGLFLVPTHTWMSVNPDHPVFDVNTAIPCLGALPSAAAFRKDGIRSLHPTHSIWAHGEHAAEFIAGEEYAETPAPPGFVGVVWVSKTQKHCRFRSNDAKQASGSRPICKSEWGWSCCPHQPLRRGFR